MNHMIDDNRFVLIEKYKQKLIEGTNISDSPEEMAVLDNILFRFWQMGWLDKLEEEAHWIPCSEGLPKEEGFYLVTLEDKCGAETTIRFFFRIENGLRYWGKWGNETITAYMPLPEPYKGVTT